MIKDLGGSIGMATKKRPKPKGPKTTAELLAEFGQAGIEGLTEVKVKKRRTTGRQTATQRRTDRKTARTVKRHPKVKATQAARRAAREILIVSRKGQPQIFTQVEPLERKNYIAIGVSSSWLSTYSYFYEEKLGLFTTKTGRQYKILNFDFDMWEKWYYSHSKGTFWNDFIRDQYTIVGTL